MTETPGTPFSGPTPEQQPTTPPPPPPPPGYGGQVPPSVPMTVQDERTWSLLAHIGSIILGFLAPLIVLLVKGNESQTVRAHATESLNFQITVLIGYVVSWILAFVLIGFFLVFVVWVVSLIFAIMGTMAASKGEPYKYPFALRLVS
ncbi:DUF4870 domain-containing protein [Tenggerimyces flavus]|uniref:DUF4870 domain-containing protein n=1 Tax=Tenggerimyces flavus TaxID=1708749 RepID=A0ABV7YIM6_9ACTN|nr:DUF4870 domain-containing protein [Tenggerimyces flavus]MBM7789260.1 putative Tic20 family protein [Tenggerimyces flavus]